MPEDVEEEEEEEEGGEEGEDGRRRRAKSGMQNIARIFYLTFFFIIGFPSEPGEDPVGLSSAFV